MGLRSEAGDVFPGAAEGPTEDLSRQRIAQMHQRIVQRLGISVEEWQEQLAAAVREAEDSEDSQQEPVTEAEREAFREWLAGGEGEEL